jgi:hypothetical protein
MVIPELKGRKSEKKEGEEDQTSCDVSFLPQP